MALLGQDTARAEPDSRRKAWFHGKITRDPTDDELLELVKLRAGSGDQGVDPTHLQLQKQWYISIIHFVGLQAFDSYNVFEDVDPNFTFLDDSYVANLLYRYMMGGASRLSQAKPGWDVTPKSPDQEDQEATKVSQHLLNHFYETKQMRRVRMDMAFWLQACGTHFLYVIWDQEMGDTQRVYKNPFSDTEEESYLNAEQLEPAGKTFLEKVGAFDDFKEGDLRLESLSGFQVLLPHAYHTLEEMPWVIIKWRKSLDWIWDHFDERIASQITSEDIFTNKDGQYWYRLSTLVNRHGFTIPSRGADNMDQIEFYELWQPPSKRVPRGIHGICTHDKVLHKGPHPFAAQGLKRRYPLIDFHYCPVPGRFWSMGLLEHLLGPQRDYNRSRAQVIQHRDVLAVPQWLTPQQAEMTNTRNDTGDMWEYRGGFGKPELVQPPAMSQIHLETLERAISDMQQIAAQSDVTQAQVPQGVRSGVAIRALQEKDYQVLGVPVENMEHGFGQLGQMVLELYWKNMKTPRIVELYGDSRQADVSWFKGADIAGNTAVRVKPGSMMPTSKAETQELLLDLLQMQAIDPTDPKWAKLVYNALEVGGADKMFLERDLDERRANIENELFRQPRPGQPWPAVSDHDDHEVHLERHRIFMKTDSFERLPPMRKIVFEAHMLQHEQALATLAETMMAMQAGPAMAGPAMAGPPGAGGPPGQASPPKETGKPSPPAKKSSPAEGGSQ